VTRTTWMRWLGLSIAVHAIVIGVLWVWLPSPGQSTLPAPLASVLAVTLLELRDVDLPVSQVRPPAKPPTAPDDAPDQPAPDPESVVEVVPPAPLPPAAPEPDPTPMNQEMSPEAFQAREPLEPRPDAPAGGDPTDSASGSASPPDAPTAQGTADEHYRPLVLAILERAKRYPFLARRWGLEGTVGIVFLIRSDGTITDPRVIAPSAHRALDEATLAMVDRVGTLPPPPDQLPLRFPVSIRYQLEATASPLSTGGALP